MSLFDGHKNTDYLLDFAAGITLADQYPDVVNWSMITKKKKKKKKANKKYANMFGQNVE